MFKRDKYLKITKTVDDEGLAALREPRDDLMAEKFVDDDKYELLHGPFSSYERRLSVRTEAKGVNKVVESYYWRLSIPFLGIFFSYLIVASSIK